MTFINKKLKKYLLSSLISFLPIIVIIIIISSGILAVMSFFSSLFNWTSEKEIDIDKLTLPELIEASKDDDIITDTALEEMMIGREELTYLLTSVNDYNNRVESKDINVQVNDRYWTWTEVWSDAQKKYVKKRVLVTDKVTLQFTVNNSIYTNAYPIDWQTVYIFCTYASLAKKIKSDTEFLTENGEELTTEDIDNVLELIKPKFTYYYDVVNNPKNSYSIKDVVSPMPREYWKEVTTTDTYYGYIPISGLKEVRTLLYLDTYTPNSAYSKFMKTETTIDMDYFMNIALRVNPDFDFDLFISLLQNLPGGKEIANAFIYHSSFLSNTPSEDIDDIILNDVTLYATNFIGLPYVWGGNSLLTGCDCSGFVREVYRKFGVNIGPRTAAAMYSEANNIGSVIQYSEAKNGDLIFYRDDNNHICHVAMYLGNGKIIHERGKAWGCRVDKDYWLSHVVGAVRINRDGNILVDKGKELIDL